MRWTFAVLIIGVLAVPTSSIAQSRPPGVTATVPRLIQVSGVFQPADGLAASAVEVVTVSIYGDADAGLPVWQEQQSVAVEKTTGRFTLLLGASHPDGIPAEVFGASQAQWMSLLFARVGEREQPRVRIASVPYALKASDAETLGGLPASAYLRAPTEAAGDVRGDTAATLTTAPPTEDVVLPGTTNFLAKYVNGADVGNSAVYETGGKVGVGTTVPFDTMHLRFNDPNGVNTGLAVQNLGNTANSYSGMLFYDQFGALAQFQGFNNLSHEYRINNIASGGSINFMLGTSRFFVGSGGVGIGTTSPSSILEVSNAISGSQGLLTVSTFSNNSSPSVFIGKKARGTSAAPAAVLNGDGLAIYGGRGHATTGFGLNITGGMSVRAAEDWTDTAQGTRLQFSTTNLGSNAATIRMTLDPAGNLGIGTPTPQAPLEIVKSGVGMILTAYGSEDSEIVLRRARGSAAAPSAVQSGDTLGAWGIGGHGGTEFGNPVVGMFGLAAENWTNDAQGAAMGFFATPVGSNEPEINMVLLPGGNIAIGDFTSIPATTDRLQVSGDIRIGTTGTNGCLKNFAGTGLIGTCASDRRYKKDITPFKPVLNQLTALQPVHYFWRSTEFPQQHFGDGRAYGLIAQDVEDVLPELVVTNEDGFKAVDYTKLPLLTIQAVKELKAENEALKAANEALAGRVSQNDALRERVEELERRMTEMIALVGNR